jgi:exodeoxyribonuclease VII small subunit
MAAAKRKSTEPIIEATAEPPAETAWNYEASVAQIEEMLALIEAGELQLDDVFALFGVAIEQLKQCETFLNERQQQVDLLIETLNDEF